MASTEARNCTVETAREPERVDEFVAVELERPTVEQVREHAARGEVVPADDAALMRYAVYLGIGYLEAEDAISGCADDAERYRRLHRLLGAAYGGEATLRFAYAEEARRHADEQRAAPAHEQMTGAYLGLIERLEQEIRLRRQRIANLRTELER